MPEHWSDKLYELGACSRSRKYALTMYSFPELWKDCETGEWLLWLAARLSNDYRHLMFCVCRCLRMAAPQEKDVILAIERWISGDDTITAQTIHDIVHKDGATISPIIATVELLMRLILSNTSDSKMNKMRIAEQASFVALRIAEVVPDGQKKCASIVRRCYINMSKDISLIAVPYTDIL